MVHLIFDQIHNHLSPHTWHQVNKRTRIPTVAVGLVTLIPCLLTLIYIGSSTAYEDVISLSVCGLYGSYFFPCVCLLWRRCTGQIRKSSPHDTDDARLSAVLAGRTVPNQGSAIASAGNQGAAIATNSDVLIDPPLEWGPWHIPGVLGIINNGFACLYILFVLFWDFWPPETPATPENMNYSCLVFGVVIGFAIVYYYVWGRQHYRGPLIDYEVRSIANGFIVERKESTMTSPTK